MKRKITLLLVSAMVLCLAGCSDTKTEQSSQPPVSTQKIPVKQNVTTVVGKNAYAGIAKAGKASFVVQEEKGGTYKIVDAEGNKVLQDEFDYFNMDLEGDYYSVGKKIAVDEKTVQYQYYLYDGDDKLVFENTNYRDYHIYHLNNGILQLRRELVSTGVDGNKKVNFYTCYLDINNGFAEVGHISDNIDSPVSFVAGYSKGVAPFIPERLVTVNATSRLYTLIDAAGELQEVTMSNGCLGRALSSSISANGWMLMEAIDKATVKSTGIYFYNVETKQEVAWPEGYESWEAFYDGGYGAVFTVGNYVAVTPKIEGDGDSEYDIFDLSQGKIIADTDFASIDLRTYDSGYMVAKKNSQFAYINQKFEVASTWYVSAADIVNGYGVIIDNGTVYTINDKFEKETVVTAGEYVAYLGGQYYSVKHNGEYYLLQVIPAE